MMERQPQPKEKCSREQGLVSCMHWWGQSCTCALDTLLLPGGVTGMGTKGVLVLCVHRAHPSLCPTSSPCHQQLFSGPGAGAVLS